MSNRLGKQLDLLQDCNDQHVPPKEFMGIFCKRCRNGDCVNAGWAESTWGDRIATQLSRLILNPNFADPSDSTFDPVRDLDFRQVTEPLVVSGDPWAVPQVHLADLERQTNRNTEVEIAVRRLNENRESSLKVEPQVQAPAPQVHVITQEPPKPPPPVNTSQGPVRPNPRHYSTEAPPTETLPVPAPREVNTSFPMEGLMLDGSPPSAPTPASVTGEDPWAAPAGPKVRKVAVGARVRMGEEPKK